VAAGAGRIIHGPVSGTLEALLELLQVQDTAEDEGVDTAWRDGLRTANARAWSLVDAAVRDGFSEGAAIRAVVERLPRDSVLALGNSLPIREVERFVPAGDRGLQVCSQRGANGIDGLVSGSVGAATATGRPTTLLLGDVSFLHDVGGLAAARHLPAPLAVVVLNNGGGRIFERLPLAELVGDDPRFSTWLTPPRLDIPAACQAFGIEYARTTDLATLRTEVDAALTLPALPENGEATDPDQPSPPGAHARTRSLCTVIEVVVPPGGTTAHQKQIRAGLTEELRR
jgi:2-succinyl-5-enolpyruvyl-6-hydroxy-3-cyclohexene-1-carboxylate synthase